MNLIKKLIISGMVLSISIPTLGFEDFSFGSVETPTQQPPTSYDENNDIDNEISEIITSEETETELKEELPEVDLKHSTLQFVVDVTQKYPKQIDTGIAYTKKLAKDTIYEVINQIAVAKRSPLIEDVDRVVALVDGVIVEVPLKEMAINEFSQLLKKTNVFVDFKDSRKEQQFNLTEYLEIYEKVNLIVDGTKIEFYNEPVIRNSRSLLPVREIVEGLGAEIVSKYKDGKIYAEVRMGDNLIKINEGSSIIVINGEPVDTGVAAEVVEVKDGSRFFGSLDEIIEVLNGEIYWDAQIGSLVVRRK